MIQAISRFTLRAEDYTPPVVVPRVIVYPSPIRLGKYSQQSPSSPLVTEIIEYGDYFSPVVPPPPDSQVDSQVDSQTDSQVVPVAPSILVQPVETQVGQAALLGGIQIGNLLERENLPYLEFKIVAAGTNLTYQWRQNNVPIANSNTDTLRIYELYDLTSGSSQENNNNYFTCVVSNELGSVTSQFPGVRVVTYNNYYPIQVTNYGSTIPPLVPTTNNPNYSFITTFSAEANSANVIDLNTATFSVPYRPNVNLQYVWSAGLNAPSYTTVNPKKITFTMGGASTTFNLTLRSSPSNVTDVNFIVNLQQIPLSGSNLTTYQNIRNLGISLLPTNLTEDIFDPYKLYVFLSRGPSGGTFNTNFWGYSQRETFNFSGVCFSTHLNVTLVTPQHFISAHHFTPNPGTKIYFYRHSDGSAVEAEIQSYQRYGDTDFQIGKLVSPITDPHIKIYPIISNFSHNLYDLSGFNYNLPIYAFAGKSVGGEDWGLSVMTYKHSNSSGDTININCKVPTLSEFSNTLPAYRIGKWADDGDSSNPIFCITSAGLTLMACWHTSDKTLQSSGDGPSVAYPAISTFIDEYLANPSNNPSGYNVTRVSLGMPGS